MSPACTGARYGDLRGRDATSSGPVAKDPPGGTQGLHPHPTPPSPSRSPAPQKAMSLPAFPLLLLPRRLPSRLAAHRCCSLPGLPFPVLPLLLPFRSDTSPPPPRSQTQAPPQHAPRWPPFPRKKEQTKQIKFAFHSRAPSARGTELPKVSREESALPPAPFLLPGLNYPSFTKGSVGIIYPLPSTHLLLPRGKCGRLCPPAERDSGGLWKAAEATPSPFIWQRGAARTARDASRAGVGCSPCSPERRSISCRLSASPSPGRGANPNCRLEKERRAAPPIAQACSSPASPEERGSPKGVASPKPAQRTGNEQDGSSRSGRPELGMQTMRRWALPAAHPPPYAWPQGWGKAASSCPGRRGRRSPPALLLALVLEGALLEDAWTRQGVVGGGRHRQQAERD